MQRFTLLHLCRSVTYILWSNDFVMYLEDYLMDECCTGDIDEACLWYFGIRDIGPFYVGIFGYL